MMPASTADHSTDGASPSLAAASWLESSARRSMICSVPAPANRTITDPPGPSSRYTRFVRLGNLVAVTARSADATEDSDRDAALLSLSIVIARNRIPSAALHGRLS